MLVVALVLLPAAAAAQQTGLMATTSGANIVLSWTLDPNPSVTGQYIARSFTSGGESYAAALALVGPTVTTYTDATGGDGLTYYYTIESCTGASPSQVCTPDLSEVSATRPISGRPPLPTLPTGMTVSGLTYSGTVMDTTWNPPVGGTPCAAHNTAQFAACLTSSSPGDIITFDSGATFTGLFTIPAKSNPSNKWIYVMPSNYSSLPPPGTRVSPSDAVNMGQFITPNVAAAIQFADGANYWRFVGMEVYSTSTTHYGTNPNTFSYFLIGENTNSVNPHHIIFDRVYVHGSPTIDIQHGVYSHIDYSAYIDGYYSDFHFKAIDAQAIATNSTPGPVKETHNYFSAATEGVFFGGSGTTVNVCDIQVQNNWFFKPLSWMPLSTAANNQMCVKNGLEYKSVCRALLDSNTIENVWIGYCGQDGEGIAVNIRPSGGGGTVNNDITITNNIWKNVTQMGEAISADYYCGYAPYTSCTNAGSQDRWYIANNLTFLGDATLAQMYHTKFFQFNGGINNVGYNNVGKGAAPSVHSYVPLKNVVFQHNTVIPMAGQNCWNGMYVGYIGLPLVNDGATTNNLWLIDNADCAQTTGDGQQHGVSGLTTYLGIPSASPNGLNQRYTGNELYGQGGTLYSVPTGNLATNTAFTYNANSVVTNPVWTTTTDGAQAGFLGVGFVAPVSYVAPTSFTNGVQGVPYVPVTASCTGGVSPFTFTLQSGAWPSGINMNSSTGVISGTPTTPGISTPNILCTDSATPTPGTDTSGPLNFTIQSAGSGLVYQLPTNPLPNAIYGAAYGPVDIVVSGGTSPYTCALETSPPSGPLPAGIALSTGPTGTNCRISATSVTGSVMAYPGIVFKVTDSAAATVDSPSLTLTVYPSPPNFGVQVSQGTVILPQTVFQ